MNPDGQSNRQINDFTFFEGKQGLSEAAKAFGLGA
jgi:hypothetical protein